MSTLQRGSKTLNHIIALIILYFVCGDCNSILAQTVEHDFQFKAVYQVTFYPDSSNMTESETEYMGLYVSDSLSVFQAINKTLRDSLIKENLKADKYYDPYADNRIADTTKYQIRHKIVGCNTDYLIEDNYQGNNLFGDPLLTYYSETVELDWIIDSDTKVVNGLNLQKATVVFGGREWTAWFAVDIPISKGPYKFNGLPGLLTNIADTKGAWSFDLLETKSELRQIDLPDRESLKIKVKTKHQFMKDRLNYFKNRTAHDIATGTIIVVGEEAKRESIRRDAEWLEKNNNWIELLD